MNNGKGQDEMPKDEDFARLYRQTLEDYREACRWQRWRMSGTCRTNGIGLTYGPGCLAEMSGRFEALRFSKTQNVGKKVAALAMAAHVAAVTMLCGLCECDGTHLGDEEFGQLAQEAADWFNIELRVLESAGGSAAAMLRARALAAVALLQRFTGAPRDVQVETYGEALDAGVDVTEWGIQDMLLDAEISLHIWSEEPFGRYAAEQIGVVCGYFPEFTVYEDGTPMACHAQALLAVANLSIDSPQQALAAGIKALEYAENLPDGGEGDDLSDLHAQTLKQHYLVAVGIVLAVALRRMGDKDRADRVIRQRLLDLDEDVLVNAGFSAPAWFEFCLRALNIAMENEAGAHGFELMETLSWTLGRYENLVRWYYQRALGNEGEAELGCAACAQTRGESAEMLRDAYREARQRTAQRVRLIKAPEDADFAIWLGFGNEVIGHLG